MEIIQSGTSTKARKNHICNFCGFVINIGEIYIKSVLKTDDIYTFKSHKECDDIAEKLDMYNRNNRDSFDDGLSEETFEHYIECEYEKLTGKLSRETIFKTKLEFIINHHKIVKNDKDI